MMTKNHIKAGLLALQEGHASITFKISLVLIIILVFPVFSEFMLFFVQVHCKWYVAVEVMIYYEF